MPPETTLQVQVEDVVRMLVELVNTPSVNTRYNAPQNVAGEQRMVEAILRSSDRLDGVQVETEFVEPGRSNVYVTIRGREGGGRTNGLLVHTDTVSGYFPAEVRDGKVFGRGSVDNKAFIAISLLMLQEMARRRLRPKDTTVFMFVVDEETGGLGATAAHAWVKRNFGKLGWLIVAEPTMNQPGCGHNGVLRVEIGFMGRSAHASTPQQGVDANLALINTATKLNDWLAGNASAWRGKYVEPTLVCTGIEGMTGGNVVCEKSKLTVDMRLTENMTAAEILKLLSSVATVEAQRCASGIAVQVTPLTEQDARFQEGGPLLDRLATLSGHAPVWLPFGTDWFRMKDAAENTVVFGPGSIEQAHRSDEFVTFVEIGRTIQIFGDLLMNGC